MTSRCNSPMPLMSVWPVSSFSRARKVGSCRFIISSTSASFFRSVELSGSMAMEMTVSGKVIDSRRIGSWGVAERVAGDRVPQADDADDVAGLDRFDLLAVVGLDPPELRHVFLLVLARVEHAAVGLQLAGVDAHVVQIAVRSAWILNTRPQNGSSGRGLRRELGVLLLGIDAFDRRHVRRAGQIGGHGVQHRLHADPVQGRAAQHRHDQVVQRGLAQRLVDQLLRHRLLGQQQLGQLVAVERKLVEHLPAPQLGLVVQFRRGFRRRRPPCLRPAAEGEHLHARPGRSGRGRPRAGAAGPGRWAG